MNQYPAKPMMDRMAQHGRYGDSMLVHMNPVEVAGIAALSPTGKLTITSSDNNLIELHPHTHPFKNVPLKLMKSKDDVRKVGRATTKNSGRTKAVPVVHEKKTGETGPTS